MAIQSALAAVFSAKSCSPEGLWFRNVTQKSSSKKTFLNKLPRPKTKTSLPHTMHGLASAGFAPSYNRRVRCRF